MVDNSTVVKDSPAENIKDLEAEMITKGNENGLISILKVLDTCIEMETNAVDTYRELAVAVDGESPRALLTWLQNTERSRLEQLIMRRRTILKRHPDLFDSGCYRMRENNGLSKLGKLTRTGMLDIMRFAINNELRALIFFERKAKAAHDEVERATYLTAVSEQKDQIEHLGANRQMLMQQEIERGAKYLAIAS